MLAALGWLTFGVVTVTAFMAIGIAGAVALFWAADKAEAFVAWTQGKRGQ